MMQHQHDIQVETLCCIWLFIFQIQVMAQVNDCVHEFSIIIIHYSSLSLQYYYSGLSRYLLQLIPVNNYSYILKKPLNIPHYYCRRTDTFKNLFFPNVINKSNKLDDKITGATSFSLLKTTLIKIGRPHTNSIYKISNPIGVRLLKRLRLGLTHLNEHKFRHNVAACVNP